MVVALGSICFLFNLLIKYITLNNAMKSVEASHDMIVHAGSTKHIEGIT